MLGKTHIIFSLFLSTFFIEPLAWVILIISGLIPDIDSSTSILGRKMKIVGRVFEHRAFFHSVFFFIPAAIIMFSFKPLIGYAFIVGYSGHILLDMLTKQGIRLYPFKKKIKGFVKVGSFSEKLFMFFFLFMFFLRIWL